MSQVSSSPAPRRQLERVCILCGSNLGHNSAYSDAARALARAIAARGIGIVYGGARSGLMGVVADEALARGGRVIGVLPEHVIPNEVAHFGLTELRVVKTMHERKQLMTDLSDAFIVLPGGYGTLDEFFEVLTWLQLGLHQKPCGLLNVHDYFALLAAFLNHAVSEGFVSLVHRRLVLMDALPDPLLDALHTISVTYVRKWT